MYLFDGKVGTSAQHHIGAERPGAERRQELVVVTLAHQSEHALQPRRPPHSPAVAKSVARPQPKLLLARWKLIAGAMLHLLLLAGQAAELPLLSTESRLLSSCESSGMAGNAGPATRQVLRRLHSTILHQQLIWMPGVSLLCPPTLSSVCDCSGLGVVQDWGEGPGQVPASPLPA